MYTVETLFQEIFSDFNLTDEQRQRCEFACSMAIESEALPEKSMVRSLQVAQILAHLKLDDETLIATLISDANLETVYPIDKVTEHFGRSTAKLVDGIRKLNKFKDFDVERKSDEVQNERLRQMLLAMTSDIRIMIVKLAYRIARLRLIKDESEEIRHQIAAETELIFAPLANRLGIAQLKWELEDLSFRYLHAEEYKDIAKQLQSKRSEREEYIKAVLETIKGMLDQNNIQARISGRPKHIYSI